MSLQSLDKKLRKQLETTIIKARNVAETVNQRRNFAGFLKKQHHIFICINI